MKKVKQSSTAMSTTRPYVPTPHPMQHRLDTFRQVAALVTAPTHRPMGK